MTPESHPTGFLSQQLPVQIHTSTESQKPAGTFSPFNSICLVDILSAGKTFPPLTHLAAQEQAEVVLQQDSSPRAQALPYRDRGQTHQTNPALLS